MLTDHPSLAQAWVYLGESLEHQNRPAEAWHAYNRGWILDPQAAWVHPMQARLGAYRNTLPPAWLQELLAVPKVSVTAVIIAKNEAESIGTAVSRLVPAVDKVLLLDTGSTDETILLAKRAGAKVHSVPWQDDFAAARNAANDLVDTQWILWVDADEFLYPDDVEIPRIVAGLFHTKDTIFRIGQANHIGQTIHTNYDMSRMYPTHRGLRWWGRIHEQIGPEEGVYSGGFNRPPVRIRFEHHGYEKQVVENRGKLQRNIALLRMSVQEHPQDVAAWGFLGRDLLVAGNPVEATVALTTAEELAIENPSYGRLSEVRCGLITALLALGKPEQAMEVANRQVAANPEYPGGWYLHGQCAMQVGTKYLAEAEASYRKALAAAPGYRGIVAFDEEIPKFKAQIGRADALRLMGNWTDALSLYELTHPHVTDPLPVMRRMGDMVRQAQHLSQSVSIRSH